MGENQIQSYPWKVGVHLEKNSGRPAELHQDQCMVLHLAWWMRTLPLTWVVPIYPFSSPCYLGHVTLYCSSSPHLFRGEAFWASLYVYAQQSPVLWSPCSPSTSLLAEATAAAEGIPGAVSPRYLMSGAKGRALDTHSAVNSFVPTGMQYTNCIALQRR